jgi:N-acetylmuramoyl-L-alanine amidase
MIKHWNVDYISVNPFSRPNIKLDSRKKTVWHYTANPSASDTAHQRYFESLKNQDPHDDKEDRYASAHLFIDKDSAVLIIPLDEVAYHAGNNWYNRNSIGVELCIEADGSFHPDTIKRAVKIGAAIAKEFKQDPMVDFVRHYDVTRKICPKPWVERPVLFDIFKKEVVTAMSEKDQSVSPWAADALKWAIENKITDGARPKDNVTREELWTMLHRAKGVK